MSSEEAYALYYDLLYSHRDVAREVDFLERVFSQCSQVSVRRVLDVGCGTGIHSIELARRGYEVLGVDLSQKMIEVAREKSRAAGVTGVYFLQADATRLEFEEEFDAAIAMYGVISYFTRDENLLEFLRSLRRALKKGGVFVFDTWNLTGVLSKRVFYETPSTSIRKSGSMLAIKRAPPHPARWGAPHRAPLRWAAGGARGVMGSAAVPPLARRVAVSQPLRPRAPVPAGEVSSSRRVPPPGNGGG